MIFKIIKKSICRVSNDTYFMVSSDYKKISGIYRARGIIGNLIYKLRNQEELDKTEE